MPLAAGQTLCHYEILGPLGAGCMGEVYRARDTRLGREVAIKVLPQELAGDAERLLRFEREARTLAALNHPNVAGIHGIDEADGTRFIAMELVPGEDLATRLERGALPLDEALDVCRQVAEGLEAAHEAGVVHRDLKPANVRVTPDGKVKVLDFGLAKPAGGDEPADSALSTQEGRLLGTPAYMAPEQARGKPIDKRADVWAFGCVLHECLTGGRAFAGESLGDVLTAVLEKQPDSSRVPADAPAHVRMLLERCLDKDPRTRLRDVGEARILLQRGAAPARPAPTRRRALPLGLAAAIALAALAVGYLGGAGRRPSGAPTNPLAGATIRKLIDWPGTEFDAAISRDGQILSFVSDRDGQFDVWWGLIDGGSPRNLTRGSRTFWSFKVRDAYFDLHGTSLLMPSNVDGRQSQIDLMSGAQRGSPLGSEIVNVSWSPDGTRMVFHLDEDGDPLYVADADGEHRELVAALQPGLHQHYPIWSADGAWIYVVRGRPATREMDLWRVSPDGEVAEQLTTDKRDVGYPTPLDANTLLYVAQEEDGAGPWLWALDLESRTSRRAGIGVETYRSVAASIDGRRLVATVANPAPRLKSVPILADRVATGEDVRPYPGLEREYTSAPRFARDGTLFYKAGGGVWRLRHGERVEVLPASEVAGLSPPAVSRDGQSLAVVSWKDDRSRLTVFGADGGHKVALAGGVEVLGAPAWSPDGDWIAVGGRDADGAGLFLFRAADGDAPPVRIADGHALNPVWSPTDDLIIYNGPQVMGICPLLGVRPSDGTPVPLPDIRVLRLDERMRFLPDGSGLVFMQGLRASQDFQLLDLQDLAAEPRRLTRLEGLASVSSMRTFDIDPSGERIVFDRLELNSDVVLIELPDVAD